ncbi:MAG: hypothetical protein U0835_03765 [Isosphaeraceae bacterium]
MNMKTLKRNRPRWVRPAALGALTLLAAAGIAWAEDQTAPTISSSSSTPTSTPLRDRAARLATYVTPWREPAGTTATATVTTPASSTLNWWTVPRKARTAAKAYAAAQNAKVSRYRRVAEPDGSAHYDVYAVRIQRPPQARRVPAGQRPRPPGETRGPGA